MLIATIGKRAFEVSLSSFKLIWNIPTHLVMANNTTAIDSWTKRKKTGISVFIRTHLFLSDESSEFGQNGSGIVRLNNHAKTI
jgi:hypothetical protein